VTKVITFFIALFTFLYCNNVHCVEHVSQEQKSNNAISIQKDEVLNVCAITQLYHVLEDIKAKFNNTLDLNIYYASSSTLYSMVINNQRNCDIYIGNDNKFIAKYIESKLALADSKLVVTKTPLALWSITSIVDKDCNILKYNTFSRIAVPDPRLYVSGFVSIQILKKLNLLKKINDKIIYAPNEFLSIGFVKNGNAMLGFVPYSLLKNNSYINKGSYCLISNDLYEPLYYYSVDFKNVNKKQLPVFKKILLEDAKSIFEQHGFY
jgi:molybdate transport system substrate-binding protein